MQDTMTTVADTTPTVEPVTPRLSFKKIRGTVDTLAVLAAGIGASVDPTQAARAVLKYWNRHAREELERFIETHPEQAREQIRDTADMLVRYAKTFPRAPDGTPNYFPPHESEGVVDAFRMLAATFWAAGGLIGTDLGGVFARGIQDQIKIFVQVFSKITFYH